MLKKLLVLALLCVSVTSCASWFSSSQEIPDSPTVGGRQDSSDMLFGQAESNPAPAPTAVPVTPPATMPATTPANTANASAAK